MKSLSQICRDAGLTSISQVTKHTGVSAQTLFNWNRSGKKEQLIDACIFYTVEKVNIERAALKKASPSKAQNFVV